MEDKIFLAKNLLTELWITNTVSLIVKKVLNIEYLNLKIPDKNLVIQEVNKIDEDDEIWYYCKPYLEKFGVYPLLGTLGDHVICVGLLEENYMQVFYYDFEFAVIGKLNDSWDDFVNILKECATWVY